VRLPGQAKPAPPPGTVRHITDHFHAGICICPCPACTDHPGDKGITRCICPHCPEHLCGARGGVVGDPGGVRPVAVNR